MKEVKLYQKGGNLYRDKDCIEVVAGDSGWIFEPVEDLSRVTLELIKQGVSVDDIIKLKNQELL